MYFYKLCDRQFVNKKFRFPAWFIPVLLLSSCSPLRKLSPDAILLNKNVIVADRSGLVQKIKPIIKQKPNRKILGLFRFHLGVYIAFNRGKERKWKNWVKNTIGEPPVLLDTALTEKSREQIRQFMVNTGYFNADVTDTTILKKGRKANVYYYIRSNEPYQIRTIEYSISDTAIRNIVLTNTSSALIKSGNRFDTRMLQQERERMTTLLKNHGYFYFTQQFISYQVDSALKSNEVDLFLQIKNRNISSDDSTLSQNHIAYSISDVFINSDFNPVRADSNLFTDSVYYSNRYFLFRTKYHNYRPAALSKNIFITKDKKYNLTDHESTYRYLADLGNFRFININFSPDTDSIGSMDRLNCFINLTPNFRQSYRVEIEGTHNGGNFGTAGSFIYANRNVLKGAELLELKLKAAFENQSNFAGEERRLLFFNTYEYGPEISLTIPQNGSQRVINLISSYNVQNRPEFNREIATFSVSKTFRMKKNVIHIVTPAEINFVAVTQDSVFKKILEDIGDPALSDSYDDHLIAGGRYSFILNTQQLNKLKSFFYFRFNFESAGNAIRAVEELRGRVPVNDSSYSILKNIYAQYIRPDVDFRFYHIIDENNTMVYRLAGGIGIPYLNSRTLPFEKSFFAGGANDLRAYSARSIGPGSYDDELRVQQSGEIKMNANIEYRFDIIRILEGALFMDAGNVWLTKDDARRPGGTFEPNRFLNEVAIGAGMGFRFDFNYFIIRLDIGYPMRDPRNADNKRWVYQNLKPDDAKFNFGIGYPF